MAILVSACSGGSNSSSAATAAMPAVVHRTAAIPSDYLFVGWNTASQSGVDVYANASGNWALSQTISQSVRLPAALAISNDKFLYVANKTGNDVTLYRLSDGGAYSGRLYKSLMAPYGLAIDSSDNVAVLNETASTGGNVVAITVFPYAKSNNPYVIVEDLAAPRSIRYDKNGELYVPNYSRNDVVGYPPDSGKADVKITDGIYHASSVATDSIGRLYVANPFAYNVTIYARQTHELKRTVLIKREEPWALMMDGDEHLYIAAYQYSSSLIDYNFKTNESTRITDGLDHPTAITKCSSTYICVMNRNNVTVYQDDKLVTTIKLAHSPPISFASM